MHSPRISSILLATLATVALTLPAASWADDTDIYLRPRTTGTTAKPLVMFTLDMKANNLSSKFCTYTGTGTDDCFSKVGASIYPLFAEAQTLYGFNYTRDGVTRFDAFRALHAALYKDLEGVEVGFMVSHNEQKADGGYVLRGFREFQKDDANGAKAELLRKLYSIPNPGGATAQAAAAAPVAAASATSVGPSGLSVCSSSGSAPAGFTRTSTSGSNNYNLTVSNRTNAAANEGQTAQFSFKIAGEVTKGTATLSWNTLGGSAVAGSDYTTVTGSKSWSPTGSGSNAVKATVNETITVNVPALTDQNTENTETFTLPISLLGALGATATGTICDVPSVQVSVNDATVTEGSPASFTVNLSKVAIGTVTVSYTTSPGTGSPGTNYQATSGVLSFAPGETSKSVSVNTIADADAVSNTFTFNLSNASSTSASDVVTFSDDVGLGTITEPAACAAGGSYDHKYQGTEMYFELFRYLTGGAILNGRKGEGDWGSSLSTNLDTECYSPGGTGILKWDDRIETGSRYISPLGPSQACTGVYAINMMFGVSNQDNALNSDIGKTTSLGGTGTTPGNSNSFADMISILGNTDLGSNTPGWTYTGTPPDGVQKLITYILRFDGPSGQFAPYAAAGANVLDADQDNLAVVLDLLKEIFRQILSVSTTFVAASVPVDVFNRASVDDNVFIALFTTDQNGKPLWSGNLKKLKLKELTNGFLLHDALSDTVTAIGSDGRIRYDALTFWTESAALPAPPTNPDPKDEARFMQAGRDGRFVARGGAGQKIPGFVLSSSSASPGNPGLSNGGATSRKLLTEAAGSTSLSAIGTSGLAALNADSATAGVLRSDLQAADDASALQLLCWARGLDDTDTDGNFCENATARQWLMSDALHSRPLPLNYGDRDGSGSSWSPSNPDIRVLMGTNDGFFRMFQNTGTDGSQSGVETWGFMPRELMKNISTLKSNVPGTPHPVGVDGQPTVLTRPGPDGVSITGTGAKAWVYFGLRRGGAAYYALDVTDPDNPKLKWSINSSTPGFSELALTFSTPTVGVVQYGSSTKEVLMFGGGYFGGGSGFGDDRPGYDSYDDAAGATAGANLTDSSGNSIVTGNAVYILDADTGALIWKATGKSGTSIPSGAAERVQGDMQHSVAAQITLADTNGDDIDDRAYVGDLGGNIWRINLPRSTSDTRATDWTVQKLATLGNGAAGGAGDQRFMDRIDFVQSQYPGSTDSFDALLFGSGDREHPTQTLVENRFYMLRDPNSSTATAKVSSDFADANCFLTLSGYTKPASCGADNIDANADLQSTGWALELDGSGEKVLAPSLTVNNQVLFTSYLPNGEIGSTGTTDPCAAGSEGSGRFYAVSLFNGYPALNQRILDDSGNQLPSSEGDRYSALKSSGIPSEIVPLGPGYFLRPDLSVGKTSGSSMFRTFWYESGVD